MWRVPKPWRENTGHSFISCSSRRGDQKDHRPLYTRSRCAQPGAGNRLDLPQVARRVAEGKKKLYRITSQKIESYLGPAKIFKDQLLKKGQVGLGTGVAWTATGGGILFVEVTKMKGKGNLPLTGHLGDVMKESAQAAVSYARSKSRDLNLDPDFYENLDVHVHVPAGAIPKDGPSAGVTMATSLISALTRIPVRKDVAMTGEITPSASSFYTAGKQAFETLIKIMEGHTVPRTTVTPTQLIVRWSCGCMPENVRQAAVAPRDVARTGKLENKREAALRALLNAAGITEQDPSLPQFRDAFGRTWDGFLLALGNKITSEEFLKTINAMIELMQKYNLPTTVWHSVISMLRRYGLGGITNHDLMLKAENLFQQARLLAESKRTGLIPS